MKQLEQGSSLTELSNNDHMALVPTGSQEHHQVGMPHPCQGAYLSLELLQHVLGLREGLQFLNSNI